MNTLLSVVLIVAQIAYFMCWRRAPAPVAYLSNNVLLAFYATNLLVAIALIFRASTKGERVGPILCGLAAIAFAVVARMGLLAV
jgi:hypothetical protein